METPEGDEYKASSRENLLKYIDAHTSLINCIYQKMHVSVSAYKILVTAHRSEGSRRKDWLTLDESVELELFQREDEFIRMH